MNKTHKKTELLQILIEEEDVNRIDELSKANEMNRTDFISKILKDYTREHLDTKSLLIKYRAELKELEERSIL